MSLCLSLSLLLSINGDVIGGAALKDVVCSREKEGRKEGTKVVAK